MPGILSRKKGKSQPSPTWAYTLHGRTSISDSESGSDEEPTPEEKPVPVSEDARLLRELDLSSRPDDAIFKSNPWTIAKVNAASRLPNPKSPATNNIKPKEAPKKRPAGRIVDAFKVQAAKPPSRNSSTKAITKQSLQKKHNVRRNQAPPYHQTSSPSHSIVSELLRPVSGLLAERNGPKPLSIVTDRSGQHTNRGQIVRQTGKAISLPKTSSHKEFSQHILRVAPFHEEPPPYFDVPDVNGAEMSDSSLQLGPPSSEDIDFSEVTIAPSLEYPAPTSNKRKSPISEAPKASRLKLQYVERPMFSGSPRSPQSSPLRQTHNFNYLPRMANSSPLRNDPTMRRLPALPLDMTRPSLSNLLRQESASQYDPVTSSFYYLQRDVSPRTESARSEEPESMRRSMAPNHRPYHDAYDALPASPDSVWTSLPAPMKRQRPAAEKKSDNFKIARLIDRKPPEGAIGSTTEFSGSSKITTYLPPPRSEPKHRSDTPGEPTRGVTLWNVKRMGHPSTYSSQKTRPEDITPVHSILSSNAQGSHHEDELRLPFNSENLGARYKKVRQAARKRKHPETQLWNVLGLPSCGQVFLDDWNELRSDVVGDVSNSMSKDRPCEIQIMSWEGSVTFRV